MTTHQSTTQKAAVAARNTFIQCLLAAAIFGAATGTLDVLDAGTFTWRTLAISATTGVLASVAAFLQHAYAAPYLRIRNASKPKRPQ
jgi:hypothetical protein